MWFDTKASKVIFPSVFLLILLILVISMSESSGESSGGNLSGSSSVNPVNDNSYQDEGYDDHHPRNLLLLRNKSESESSKSDDHHFEDPNPPSISTTANYSSGPFKEFQMRQSAKKKLRSGRSVCKISEFSCRGGKCISSDKYCDGVDHCGDGSDEPRFCTPCNRTFYGEWGTTYSISLNSATIAAALGLSHEQQLLVAGDQPQPEPEEDLSPPPLSLPKRTLNISTSGTNTNILRPGGKSQGGISKLKSVIFGTSTYPPQTVVKAHGSGPGHKKVPPTPPPQFVCQLTFAAAGDNFGDFVQVMFDSLNLGPYVSPTHDGCPQGSLQVAEINRPLTGGKWCGSGEGYAVYFSETSAIALTIGMTASTSTTTNSGPMMIAKGPGPGSSIRPVMNFSSGSSFFPQKKLEPLTGPKPIGSAADDFEFKIRYKFIPRHLAAVRFGTHLGPIDRGEVVPGTYCSRDFESCHRRRCKLQSPNYPGLYPRNVTCHYTIRHRELLPCKHVLIQVGQYRGHKVQLKGGGQPVKGPTQPSLMQEDAIMAWDDCAGGNRDSLTIHDGNSPLDPVLLVVCGGAHIPPVTSSSSELLVVFKATPFGNPMESRPNPPFPEPLRGFELDVDVVTVDSDTAEYSNFKENCTFFFVSEPSDKCLLYKPQEHGGNWISGRRGKVTNPRHTVGPNTTCRYEFKGTKQEVVWIYFVTYARLPSKDPSASKDVGNCSSKLTIRDGIDVKNEVLIGSYCDSELPKLCDHKALQHEERAVRSCGDGESYISAGPRIIIEQSFFEGTALRPIHYQFYYEFVSRHTGTDGSCHRTFILSKMKSKGVIRTTDNVFDFGRGGKSNLTCTYTFILGKYEGLKLTLKGSSFGNRPCRTVTDYETGRHICNYIAQPQQGQSETNHRNMGQSGNSHFSRRTKIIAPPRSELLLEEFIWPKLNLTSHTHCICSNYSQQSGGPTFTFLGGKVQMTFKVEGMTGHDSYENFYANLDYEVLKGEGCASDNHYKKREDSGIIELDSTYTHGPKLVGCDYYPWLIEGKENYSLYLRIPGYPMMEGDNVGEGSNPSNNPGGLGGGGVQPTPQIVNYNPPPTNFNDSTFLDNLTVSSYPENNPQITPSNGGSSNPTIFTKLMDRACPTTKNRIFIYDGNTGKLVQKICPASFSALSKTASQIVEIYSEDFGKFHSPLFPMERSRFLVEFVGRELGSYQIKWLELISAKMKTTLKVLDYEGGGNGLKVVRPVGNVTDGEHGQLRRKKPSWDETLTQLFEGQEGAPLPEGAEGLRMEEICTSYCPELKACISDKLWCDGYSHCPVTTADEAQCDTFWATLNQLLSPAVYIPVAAAALSALCCCGLVILCVAVKRMVIKMRDKGQLDIPGIPTSAASSRTSTVDRRLRDHHPDYFYDPHRPIS